MSLHKSGAAQRKENQKRQHEKRDLQTLVQVDIKKENNVETAIQSSSNEQDGLDGYETHEEIRPENASEMDLDRDIERKSVGANEIFSCQAQSIVQDRVYISIKELFKNDCKESNTVGLDI